VRLADRTEVSGVRTATARTTSQLAVILFARKGRMEGSPTRETTTLTMPFAANDFAIAEVILSAPVEAARAMPTTFEDDGTARYSIDFHSLMLISTSSVEHKIYNLI
jgi:hypothetical protein